MGNKDRVGPHRTARDRTGPDQAVLGQADRAGRDRTDRIRRRVTCEIAPDRTPVEELAADFAPNEVALALTLTQCAADYWLSLAVSLAARLPATLAALRSGSIDLARARLIDQFTTPLDDEVRPRQRVPGPGIR